jgi:hypothetical protein
MFLCFRKLVCLVCGGCLLIGLFLWVHHHRDVARAHRWNRLNSKAKRRKKKRKRRGKIRVS